MIDEKKLIEKLWEQHKGILKNKDCYSDAEEVADEICNIVSIIDDMDKINKWHIVYDGDLPKEEITVLVKLSNGEVITGGISNGKWYLGTNNIMWLYFDDVVFNEERIGIVEWREIL